MSKMNNKNIKMIWAKSTKVGCGYTLCEGGMMIVLVCQYKEASVTFTTKNEFKTRASFFLGLRTTR